MKKYVGALIFGLFLAFSGLAVQSCTSHRTVETEERVVVDPDVPHETVVKTEETKTVEERAPERHGLFQILGDIISLPFRAIGALFTAIF